GGGGRGEVCLGGRRGGRGVRGGGMATREGGVRTWWVLFSSTPAVSPIALAANTPHRSVPVMPPMPWTPNTSSESSYLKRSFSQVQAQKQTRPAATPMMMPAQGATKPDAGVMVPRPATAPEIMPSTDGLRRVDHSIAAQVSAPAQADRCVAVIA